jgi:mannose-1-phosphate guanylyltransferase / phosphomannomutase
MFENVSEAVDFDIGYGALAAPVLRAVRDSIDRRTGPVLVAVCGRARAGKSVVAHALVRALSEEDVPCLHVRLDDWIMPAAERGAKASAEARSRVDMLPSVVAALRAGASIRAPGYDAASRGAGEGVTYDPAGRSVIVLDGSFAGHRSIRSMLDFVVFVAVPPDLQRTRFCAFYRWKGFEEPAIDALWRERSVDEWPAVDAQCAGADLVLNLAGSEP